MHSTLIFRNKNKCQFWTPAPLSLKLLSETELQLVPLVGAQKLPLCIWSGLLNSLNSLHFCHSCISNGRTEMTALTKATCMWMGALTAAKESSLGEGSSREVKLTTGKLSHLCWVRHHTSFLDRSEHTGPFCSANTIQIDGQQQYWLLPIMPNIVV